MKLRWIILVMMIHACTRLRVIKTSDIELNELRECRKELTSRLTGVLLSNHPIVSTNSHGTNTNTTDNELDDGWIWKYLNEYFPGSKILKIEKSLDERASNQIYASIQGEMISHDSWTVNTGNVDYDKKISKLAAGNNVDEYQCEQHLKAMVSKLKELEAIVKDKRLNSKYNDATGLSESHIKLAIVLDSFGHYDGGLLLGNYVIQGSYSKCSRSHLILNDEDLDAKTDTHYCLAKLKIDNHLDRTLKMLQMKNVGQEIALHVGICIPKSCHSTTFTPKTEHLIQTLVDSQFRMPSSLFIDKTLKVNSIHCEIAKDSELRRLSWQARTLVVFLISWIILVIYATYRKSIANLSQIEKVNDEKTTRKPCIKIAEEISERKSRIQTVYDSINLQQSWQELVHVRANDLHKEINLNSLSFFKVFSCMTIMLGHTFGAFLLVKPKNHISTLIELDNEPKYSFTYNLTNLVDTFFVMSGLLITYSVMKKLSNQLCKHWSLLEFTKHWSLLFASRYMRLAPLFFLVFLFKKSLFMHLGSGPNWDHGINRNTCIGSCQLTGGWSDWLRPLSLTTNFDTMREPCLTQGWSISNDIFFAFALTPIIILMVKNPLLAIALSTIISLVSSYSMLSSFDTTTDKISNLTYQAKFVSLLMRLKSSDEYYIAPYNRASAFLVGVIFGYLIYRYEQFKLKRQWIRWFRGVTTHLSILVMILSSIYMPMIAAYRNSFFKLYSVHGYLFAYSFTAGKLFWALASSVIFLRMVTDWKDNLLMKFCSARIWQIMERLNYAFLLVHSDIILFKLLSKLHHTESQFSELVFITSSIGFYSYLMALFVHLFFEIPLKNLINQFIFSRLLRPRDSKSVTCDKKRK